jgi:hypothetical protein
MAATNSAPAHRFVTLAALVLALTCASPAFAQRYGQNAGAGGFVPFADGPVPAGTTGTGTGTNGSTMNTSATASNSQNSLALGNNSNLSFNNGVLTLTATNVNQNSLLGFISSFGDLNFTFQSMLGTQIHVQSTFSGSTLTLTVDFNGSFGQDINGDTTDDGSSNVPDANPVDDNPNTDDDVNTSPGNPFAQ